jgi:hypothetical protein
MKKIAINTCYGGFGLSDAAYEKLNELGMSFVKNGRYWEPYSWPDGNRANSLLIQVVEELGEAANGEFAKLKIVEIPDGVDYYIDEYDGMEHIAERHQTWY